MLAATPACSISSDLRPSSTGAPLTKKDLDGSIEDWFRAKHQLDLEFEVEDAVAKLQRLELLQCSGQGLTAHLSSKPSSSSTTSGTTSSLMLVSRGIRNTVSGELSQQQETSSTSNAADLADTLTQQLGLSSPTIAWKLLRRTAAQPLLPDAI
jgi:hypothetical protein